eukprot:TRINITY_DN58_c0_g2_i2.p1 TRINITY_DN58_c0_g2~~TRINITY_DN58_c0_g2_i2.p1  ORF type:complete len:164 (+),score=5.93 TRINITY_DN58_c0_g2_i2:20-511(+)
MQMVASQMNLTRPQSLSGRRAVLAAVLPRRNRITGGARAAAFSSVTSVPRPNQVQFRPHNPQPSLPPYSQQPGYFTISYRDDSTNVSHTRVAVGSDGRVTVDKRTYYASVVQLVDARRDVLAVPCTGSALAALFPPAGCAAGTTPHKKPRNPYMPLEQSGGLC